MTKIKNPSRVKQLVEANPTFERTVPPNEPFLNIAEFFRQTVQGEGVNIGVPSAFLRLQHCTLSCLWCDTQSVWRYGNPYTFNEMFTLIETSGLLDDLKSGHHLILTGGSPVKQQDKLIEFFKEFKKRYNFLPHLEIENECTILPKQELVDIISTWNNSPKLKNSGNPDVLRYKPKVLEFINNLENSWFKFVVGGEEDWLEIEEDFINEGLVSKEKIILMPLGGDIEELEANRVWAAELAIRENVRFTDRLHVTLWNTLTGV